MHTVAPIDLDATPAKTATTTSVAATDGARPARLLRRSGYPPQD